MTVLLQGVVGSTAQGLAREGSDVDRLGVFVAPTIEVAGLHWHAHKETKSVGAGDNTHHEVGKFLRLALKCNPTLLELLYLPSEHLEIVHLFYGTRLIGLKDAFLSTAYVRNSYGGYAHQQVIRLLKLPKFTMPDDMRRREKKHARHMLRLLRQGRELLETGSLSVRVSDPEEYFALDEMTTDQMTDLYEHENELFDRAESVLPSKPDLDRVEFYLTSVRTQFLGI